MPRYYIDTDDGRTPLSDEDGYVLPDVWAARALALRALSDMIRDDPAAGDRRVLSARVRGEDGGTLYTAAWALTGEWQVAPPDA